jgi:hypothetical protein
MPTSDDTEPAVSAFSLEVKHYEAEIARQKKISVRLRLSAAPI